MKNEGSLIFDTERVLSTRDWLAVQLRSRVVADLGREKDTINMTSYTFEVVR